MKIIQTTMLLATASALIALPCAAGELLINGGFEAGFTGWTRADQLGSEGTFALQTGTASPALGLPVPAPPGGSSAAMTDAEGPGSHVLYQDFTVPVAIGTNYVLSFSLYLNNYASTYYVPSPATLDFSTRALNQQFRADITSTSADPFSVDVGDILQTLYSTQPGDPPESGYNLISTDVTALLAAHTGQTLRLRFAEVDNVDIFNAGVDDVSLTDQAAVPEPSTIVAGVGVAGILLVRRWRQKRS